jgi:hypothetical protein
MAEKGRIDSAEHEPGTEYSAYPLILIPYDALDANDLNLTIVYEGHEKL